MNLIDIPSSIDMLFDKVLTIFLIAIGSFHTTSLIACIMNITAVSEIFHFTWSTKGFGTSTWFNQGFIVLNSHSVRLGTIECGGCRECDDKEDEEHHAESDRGLSCLRAVTSLLRQGNLRYCLLLRAVEVAAPPPARLGFCYGEDAWQACSRFSLTKLDSGRYCLDNEINFCLCLYSSI